MKIKEGHFAHHAGKLEEANAPSRLWLIGYYLLTSFVFIKIMFYKNYFYLLIVVFVVLCILLVHWPQKLISFDIIYRRA